MRLFYLVPLLACLVSAFSIRVSAQGSSSAGLVADAPVAVSAVKFLMARSESGTSWLEAEIKLAVRPGGRPVTGEFIDRVRITLNLAFETAGTKGAFSFYRSTVEAITLEGGEAIVRFYLPPEVVKRDRLRGDAKYYAVDVEVGGRLQLPSRGSFQAAEQTPAALKNFQNEVSGKAGVNDGVLMPQYLTPFASDPRRPSPTFLRRENQR